MKNKVHQKQREKDEEDSRLKDLLRASILKH
jgi:hypothetical protein